MFQSNKWSKSDEIELYYDSIVIFGLKGKILKGI